MAILKEVGRIAGNTVNSVIENARGTLATIGKGALHTLAPDNFEYYMCSLELIDSLGNSKGFLSFSVMPNSITESKTNIISITKTNKGLISMMNGSFMPRDISIQGTFGRKLRLLLGQKEVEEVKSLPIFGGNLGIKFIDGNSVLIKSGYGLTKMLQYLVNASQQLDSRGKPCVLIFNNYALNTHYVVEVLQDSYNQSIENNMIWFYSLELKAIAPASALRTQEQTNSKFLSTVATGAIAKGIEGILKDISRSTIGALNL